MMKCLKLCFAICRSIPVLFIVGVIFWSYYVYVIQLCFITISNPIVKVICLLIYHPIFFMFIWSYWRSIFTPISLIPKKFYLPESIVNQLSLDIDRVERRNILLNAFSRLPVQQRNISGELRCCDRCKCIKPDRAHHCSICGKCILKMDHHCPWINNCVCFANYKFFILFLFYGEVYCLYVVLSTLYFFIAFFKKNEIGKNLISLHIVLVFFAACMFALSLLLLGCYHIFLILKNRTSIESFQTPIISGPDANAYNLGYYSNFTQVFGRKKLLWLIPVYTSLGNGVTYPLRKSQIIDDANLNLLAQSMDNDGSSGDTEEGDDIVENNKYDSKVFW